MRRGCQMTLEVGQHVATGHNDLRPWAKTNWALSPTPLDFYFSYKQIDEEEEREIEFKDYISRINQAIDSYKPPDPHYNNMHVSKAFRVHMPASPGHHFDKWLQFAFSRKVQIIELNIISGRDLVYKLITCKQSLLGVKELCLSSICLDKKDIELILSKFVFLEHLSIHSPGFNLVKNLRLVGHAKLTHFSISDVWTIQSIQVRDMISLVSLRINKLCSTYSLLLVRVPNLVHLNLGQRYVMLPDVLPKLSCIHHQLLHLKLSIYPMYITNDIFRHPKLISLKHMELSVKMGDRCVIHQLFPLIEACPSLEKLQVEFSWAFDAKYFRRRFNRGRVRRKKPSYNLKEVKLSGYFGSVSELELVMYLMNNAVGLQELEIKACDISREIREKVIALQLIRNTKFS